MTKINLRKIENNVVHVGGKAKAGRGGEEAWVSIS